MFSLLPGGVEALEALRFSCENPAQSGTSKHLERCRLDGVRPTEARTWIASTKLNFRVALELGVIALLGSYTHLFSRCPRSSSRARFFGRNGPNA